MSLDRLRAARNQLRETEECADQTLLELKRQRRIIEQQPDKLEATQREQNRAYRFLNRMMAWWRNP